MSAASAQAVSLSSESLISRLPPVRGRLGVQVPLAGVTWFRVGGPAEVLFRPADRDDLAAFLTACPSDVPVTVIGVGSNLLVRDGGGVPGVECGGDGGECVSQGRQASKHTKMSNKQSLRHF